MQRWILFGIISLLGMHIHKIRYLKGNILALFSESKNNINEIVPFLQNIKTQHLCQVPKFINIKVRFSSP